MSGAHRAGPDPIWRLLAWAAGCYGLWAVLIAALLSGAYR